LPEAPCNQSCRFVITIHDSTPIRFPKWNSLLTLYHKYILPDVAKKAMHILCNSQATMQDAMRFNKISPQKISVTYLGHDEEKFHTLSEDHYSPVKQKKYFLYTGRPDPNKNLFRLLESFSICYHDAKFDKDFELWIVGKFDTRYTPQLMRYSKKLRVENHIKFLDYVSSEELKTIRRGATAVVFPSLWEGFGLPVLEAMACGTPVVTSNISSLPEIVGNAAMLVNPYKPIEIAEAMKTISADKILQKTLSERGVEQAKKFSWQASGEETLKIIERFL
jgi:glycosyltransferase involved in cell wall biosynthesis